MDFDALSSGLPKLDEAVGGGYPRRSVTALLGGGHTMCDRLVLTGVGEHATAMLSLTRPKASVERDLDAFHGEGREWNVIAADEDKMHRSIDAVFDCDAEFVVIDGAERLFEEPRALSLVQDVVEHTLDAECATVLSFSMPPSGVGGDVRSALHLADVVLTFEVQTQSGRLENTATVTKHRFHEPTDPIKLLFDPHPSVDGTNRID